MLYTLDSKNTTMHHWSADNTIIFSQMWNKNLFQIDAAGGEPLQLNKPDSLISNILYPQLLLENENWSDYNGGRMHYRNYDISPKGDRFVITQSTMKEQYQFIIVHNWFEELKAKMIANKGKS